MTDSDSADDSVFLKTDAVGRVRTTQAQRESLLDAFESGGLSGPEFARVHGLKYQTFASWRKKRRRERGDYPRAQPEKAAGESFTLIEAGLEEAEPGPASRASSGGLVIELRGGASIKVTDSSDIRLAVEILTTLSTCPTPRC